MKLHLGCGKRYIPGFIHVDLGNFPHIDYQHDIATLPMIKDESVDLIYCSHGIEYFDREEVLGVLREWRRVLIPNGILRLALPDLEALVGVYIKYKNLELIIGPLYGRWKIPGSKNKIIYHKTAYDFDSLKRILEKCGFSSVHRYDWKKTIHKEYDDYSQAYIPHMDKDAGMLISLNVEARRV